MVRPTGQACPYSPYCHRPRVIGRPAPSLYHDRAVITGDATLLSKSFGRRAIYSFGWCLFTTETDKTFGRGSAPASRQDWNPVPSDGPGREDGTGLSLCNLRERSPHGRKRHASGRCTRRPRSACRIGAGIARSAALEIHSQSPMRRTKISHPELCGLKEYQNICRSGAGHLFQNPALTSLGSVLPMKRNKMHVLELNDFSRTTLGGSISICAKITSLLYFSFWNVGISLISVCWAQGWRQLLLGERQRDDDLVHPALPASCRL